MNIATYGIKPLLLIVLVSDICSAGDEIDCPATVRLTSGHVVAEKSTTDYKPYISGSIVRLSGMTVFDGPPEEGAALKPSSTSRRGERVKWVFEGTYPNGKWFSCDYANGLLRLTKQIPDSSTACVAVATKSKPYNVLEVRWGCK